MVVRVSNAALRREARVALRCSCQKYSKPSVIPTESWRCWAFTIYEAVLYFQSNTLLILVKFSLSISNLQPGRLAGLQEAAFHPLPGTLIYVIPPAHHYWNIIKISSSWRGGTPWIASVGYVRKRRPWPQLSLHVTTAHHGHAPYTSHGAVAWSLQQRSITKHTAHSPNWCLYVVSGQCPSSTGSKTLKCLLRWDQASSPAWHLVCH